MLGSCKWWGNLENGKKWSNKWSKKWSNVLTFGEKVEFFILLKTGFNDFDDFLSDCREEQYRGAVLF